MGVRMRMKMNAGTVTREKSHPGSAMRRRTNAPATRSVLVRHRPLRTPLFLKPPLEEALHQVAEECPDREQDDRKERLAGEKNQVVRTPGPDLHEPDTDPGKDAGHEPRNVFPSPNILRPSV